MDRLGKDGLIFDLAYAQIPHCSPSRNSLLSGQRPNTIQTWNFFGHYRRQEVDFGIVSLPQYFREHGFFVTGAGKIHHPNLPPGFDEDLSWSEPYVGAGSGFCADTKGGRNTSYPCENNSAKADNAVADTIVPRLEKLVQDGITADHGKPFFVAAGTVPPHSHPKC
jgi:arylsulfatase A-like enzyme